MLRTAIKIALVLLPSLSMAQSVVQVINGGTGATDAATARTNLGIVNSSIPAGIIAFIKTGACPSGWTEDDTLATYNILVTTTAAGDVGTSGASTLTASAQAFTGSSATSSATSAGTPAGSNASGSYAPGAIAWPAGVPTIAAGIFTQPVIAAGSFTQPVIAAGVFTQPTISWPVGVPAFTGSAGTGPAQTFTGSSATTSAVSGGTPAGTNGASATSGNCAATNIAAGTGSLNACKATAPNLTVTAQVFTGSALSTHTHTLTATGTNGTAAFTPAGTVAWPAGVPTNASGAFAEGAISGGAFTEGAISGGAFTQGAISWPGGVPTISAGTFTQPTFAGSALATHTHTLTATGTNASSAVTGVPAYFKVIACSKN